MLTLVLEEGCSGGELERGGSGVVGRPKIASILTFICRCGSALWSWRFGVPLTLALPVTVWSFVRQQSPFQAREEMPVGGRRGRVTVIAAVAEKHIRWFA